MNLNPFINWFLAIPIWFWISAGCQQPKVQPMAIKTVLDTGVYLVSPHGFASLMTEEVTVWPWLDDIRIRVINFPGHYKLARYLPGDCNQDGTVDILDLNYFKAQWARPVTAENCTADLNSDWQIDASDLMILKGLMP